MPPLRDGDCRKRYFERKIVIKKILISKGSFIFKKINYTEGYLIKSIEGAETNKKMKKYLLIFLLSAHTFVGIAQSINSNNQLKTAQDLLIHTSAFNY